MIARAFTELLPKQLSVACVIDNVIHHNYSCNFYIQPYKTSPALIRRFCHSVTAIVPRFSFVSVHAVSNKYQKFMSKKLMEWDFFCQYALSQPRFSRILMGQSLFQFHCQRVSSPTPMGTSQPSIHGDLDGESIGLCHKHEPKNGWG